MAVGRHIPFTPSTHRLHLCERKQALRGVTTMKDISMKNQRIIHPKLATLLLGGFLALTLIEAWRRSGGDAAKTPTKSIPFSPPESGRHNSYERRADFWRWHVAASSSDSFPGEIERERSEPDTAASNRTNATSRIANELVVTLPAGADLKELLNLLNTKVEVAGSLDKRNAHRLRFSDAKSAEAAQAYLDANPQLGTADANYRMEMPPPEDASGEKMGVKRSLRMNSNQTDGQIVVGLVDSTVQLQGTAVDGYLLPGISVAEGKASEDSLSHGTSMAASIVQGLSLSLDDRSSSGVKILPVDVYGSETSTTTFQVAEGITRAMEGGANIINLSLGSDGDSALLRQIIQEGHSRGVIFLGAAGNESVTTPTYPAAYSEVIAVTATDYDGNIASYANYGEFVDVGTPGSVIVEFNGKRYLVSGTSASTALASGIAAGYSEKNTAKPAEAEAAVRSGLAVQTK